jgi:hypothetical protein
MNFSYSFLTLIPMGFFHSKIGGSRGRIHMIIGFITTYAISAYHHHRCEFESRSGKVYSMSHVGGFLWLLQFPPPIKLTATI